MFKLFADLIASHLDAQERLELSETALMDERHTALLREQFVAVLGHDLRNPLNAIYTGTQVLLKMPLDDSASSVAVMVQSAARMAGLIDNLMDFARGRLGGGIPVSRIVERNLETILQQTIAEVRITSPNRSIHGDFNLSQPVVCDGPRIAQMLSNLLANALTHGDPQGPVRVNGRSDGNGFELSVSNLGKPIAPEDIPVSFSPFRVPRPARSSEDLVLVCTSRRR